jgi:hypothetical protein
MILWLDDIRDPKDHGFPDAVWAKNYWQAIAVLKTGDVVSASLDHDIGACEKCTELGLHVGDMLTPETTFYNNCPHARTGYDVLCWMEENNVWPPEGVQVHTANPVGRARMQQVVNKAYQYIKEPSE